LGISQLWLVPFLDPLHILQRRWESLDMLGSVRLYLGGWHKIRFGRLTHWTGLDSDMERAPQTFFFAFDSWLMTLSWVLAHTHTLPWLFAFYNKCWIHNNTRTPSTEDSWSGLSSMLLQRCWTYKGDSTKTWSDPHFFRVSFLLWRFCYWMLLVVNC
jgi:hypothetical protein